MDALSYAALVPAAYQVSSEPLEPPSHEGGVNLAELFGQASSADLHLALGALATPPRDPQGDGAIHERAPAPGFLPDLPAGIFSAATSPAHTVPAHASPPAGLAGGAFAPAPSPAHLAALTNGFLAGSPSDAHGSPVPLSSGSDHAYSSSSGTPASPPELGSFTFAAPAPAPAPAPVAYDPHMMTVQSMLGNIASTAQSAQRSCAGGHSSIASSQIDQLKRTIGLLSQLFNTIQIDDDVAPVLRSVGAPGELSLPPSVPPSIPPSLPISPPQQQQQQQQMDTYMALAGALQSLPDTSSHLDVGDNARKRCASSMNDERVVKAIKREPLADSHVLGLAGSSLTTPVGTQYSPPATATTMQPPSLPDIPGSGYATPSAPDFGMVPTADVAQNGFEMEIPPVGPDYVISRRNTWSERPPALQHRHTLSVGTGLTMSGLGLGPPSAGLVGSSLPPPPFTSAGAFGPPPIPPLSAGQDIAPGVPRTARSMSLTAAYQKPVFPLGFEGAGAPLPAAFADGAALGELYQMPPDEYPFAHSPDEDYEDAPSSGSHSPARGRPSTAGGTSRMPSRTRPDAAVNEIPPEYRADVDRVFFGFLERICSDLDATDAKGELIHQTLMAKKMQRLDESPDFRPFKFRIQAFTNAFLEELCRQGYPEEVLPMKKVRHYLWNNQYISRYNEEGKKTKSKGNHIWSIDARKLGDGGWTFRPFHRRLAGQPPPVAYIGLRWSWTPRIWDPQNARPTLHVRYSSPWLPAWLAWADDVLAGTPSSDAESCEVVVNASHMQDGQEETLSHKIQIHVAPMSSIDSSTAAAAASLRRPSLTSLSNDIGGDPRRIASDTVVPQAVAGRSRAGSRVSSGLVPKPVPNSTDAQVVQVLEQAAERVAQQTQEQVIASAAAGVPIPDMNQLVAQRNVLTFTAKVYGEVTGQTPSTVPQTTPVVALADQAKQMVFSAAVVASSHAPSAPPTVNAVSVAAQHAVAHALEITGPLSNEVQVLMTARSLLESSAAGPPPPSAPPAAVPFPSASHRPVPVHSGFVARC